MTADTLLSTKLRIPEARANQVARPRLIARLTDGLRLGRRLTLVSAPPGFGKTTLIREWAGATGRYIAWIALDEGDNDAARLMRYVSAAVAQADAQIELALRRAALPASPHESLVAFINELTRSEVQVLLVLDDYHLIREFAVHDLVAFLLANQPPGLHVVIGTREDPPLPLARMRARDQITQVREHALRFAPDEASAFFGQTMGLTISPASIAALVARTEGWITGLQLAGLALGQLAGEARSPTAADEFVAAFAGDDRYIVDYLMAEVLEHEPEPVRSFLRQTSILDRLSAPLCDAITGRGDSQAILQHLTDANVFLTPLDNRREWYRYHVLFAQVLRLTLTPHDQSNLHLKAADWFKARGWDELALQHTRRAQATPARDATTPQPLVEPLSERELEVVRLIAAGLSNQEIAARLVIAPGTVKRHINNIYGKLGVQSRTQAVARSRELGFL